MNLTNVKTKWRKPLLSPKARGHKRSKETLCAPSNISAWTLMRGVTVYMYVKLSNFLNDRCGDGDIGLHTTNADAGWRKHRRRRMSDNKPFKVYLSRVVIPSQFFVIFCHCLVTYWLNIDINIWNNLNNKFFCPYYQKIIDFFQFWTQSQIICGRDGICLGPLITRTTSI